jgi:molecular chaperone DnaK (HSP70)
MQSSSPARADAGPDTRTEQRSQGGTVAIDLGSSTTVVAYQAAGGEPRLVSLPPYSLGDPPVVPSLLWLQTADQGRPLIGRQVLEAGLGHGDGPELHRDFKRQIGARPPTGGRRSPAPGLPLSAEQAGALLLRRLWCALPPDLAPERLVLTAPIEAYQGYRSWLVEACHALAVAELALVDEPTAAAVGSGLPPGSTVLVVDLGGSTIDLCLVQLQGGEGRPNPIAQLLRLGGRDLAESRQRQRLARVIGKAGLALGGRDIDRWIASHLCPEDPPTGALLDGCERLKCALSEQDEALVVVNGADGSPRELRLSRAELLLLLQRHGLLLQLDVLLEEVLAAGRSASIGPEGITAVLPVGGSSRLVGVPEWLAERLGAIPIHTSRPVEAVALGALALTPGVRVQDVLSRGVSLRCWDRRSNRHLWHPLFMAGQSWPTTAPLELVLACREDRQNALELVLGEPGDERRREVVFDGQGLPVLRSATAGDAEVRAWSQQPDPLPLDPPGRQGEDRLRLRFSINAQGELELESTDLVSGSNLPVRRLGRVR